MDLSFYRLLGIQVKPINNTMDTRTKGLSAIDFFIAEFLKKFDVETDFLCTTNVGLLNIDSTSAGTILWDISYWQIYEKYLAFVYWMEYEKKNVSDELDVAKCPLNLRKNSFLNQSKPDACRLVFLSTLFQYLSYKFYYNKDLSYCFALLYNENKGFMTHEVSDREIEQYDMYISEQIAIIKLFCAFHEAYHLKKIPSCGEYQKYCERILHNIRTLVNSKEFKKEYAYDVNLMKDVQKRVNNMNYDDPLFDELYADAGALDYLDIVINYLNVIQPKWSLEKFALVTKVAIENFYTFNTLTYELYLSWDLNLKVRNGHITEKVYKKEIHKKDIEDVIRSQIFPFILWVQIDNFLQERGKKATLLDKRYVNVRREMIHFYNIAYNSVIKEAVFSAISKGFTNGILTIEEARDILIEWEGFDKYPNASEKDLFLNGGTNNEADFYMFVRGY